MSTSSPTTRSPRRRVALALTACASVGAFVVGAAPANAVTPPDWPSAGRVPVGCEPGITYTNINASSWTYQFTDSSEPVISDPLISSNSTNVSVIPVAGVPVSASLKITDTCSGVAGAIMNWSWNGLVISGATLDPASADVFTGRWTHAFGLAKPDNAGAYRIPVALTGRRYDSITLDQDFKLVSKVNAVGGGVTMTGAWALQTSYLLRQTTVTIAAPTSVKKGKLATISGVLKYATNAGLVADNGEKVLVQTRVGSGAWKTVATVTANASGAYSAKVKLLKTSQVRVVHGAVFSGRFTAAVTSATKTVKAV